MKLHKDMPSKYGGWYIVEWPEDSEVVSYAIALPRGPFSASHFLPDTPIYETLEEAKLMMALITYDARR